jgi:predicted GH43/DUF377 family glycosyl hydrolase
MEVAMKIFATAVALFLCTITTRELYCQTTWQKYPQPILPAWSGDINDAARHKYTYEPFVMYDSAAGLYKMWFAYQALGYGVTFNIGYAVSFDGIEWLVYAKNPVLRVGNPGSFDGAGLFDPFVIKVGNQYRMYYTGHNGSLLQTGLAFSSDGIKWQKYAGNPILTVRPGTWESITANAPRVFYDGNRYVMFYVGYNGSVYEVGLATSADGLVWERHPNNPVLRRGPSGSWDQNSVITCGAFTGNGRYYLLYNGGPYTPIGFASSVDGVTWTKYAGNPVFFTGGPGTWDESRVEYGAVVREGTLLKYWYCGFGYSNVLGMNVWQIGYATSALVTTVPGTVPLPSEYRLADAYPNPFNPSTTIEYEVPAEARIQIIIFDALGQRVATLVDEVQQPGYHKVQWSPKEQASGVYFYQMNAPAFSETKKLVLLK